MAFEDLPKDLPTFIDRFGSEFSITGEELDEGRRGAMLDESLDILTAAWTGQPVHHHGEHYTVDGMRFLPRPVQQPGVPVWAIDADGLVVRPGPRLVDGVEAIAAILHPDAVPAPPPGRIARLA